MTTVAGRGYLALVGWQSARGGRDGRVAPEPLPGEASGADETLAFYFLCARPVLSPASWVALTLRAVGG